MLVSSGSCLLIALVLGFLPKGTADRIVAVVGEEPILQSQVDAGVQILRLSLGQTADTLNPPADSTLARQVLEQLISEQVILEQAKVESITVTKAQVDAELEDAIRRLKARFSTPDSFAKALREQGLTEATLRQRYRSDITRQLTIRQLMAKHNLLENILVAPTEVQQYYRTHRDSFGTIPGRVRLAHILIIPKPPKESEQRAYEQITQAYIGLTQSNWDFEAVASSFSTDPETRRRSGLIGQVRRGELPEEVESVVFSLKTGAVSPPFRSRLGWMILRREGGDSSAPVIRQILIRMPLTKSDSNQALRLAQELRQRASQGEDFAQLAKQYSDDPNTKDSGGELGEFLASSLSPPYSDAIAHLSSGALSEPILSEHGYHLIKVLDRVEERVPTYEELQDDIRDFLYSQKVKAKIDDFVSLHAKKISIQRF